MKKNKGWVVALEAVSSEHVFRNKDLAEGVDKATVEEKRRQYALYTIAQADIKKEIHMRKKNKELRIRLENEHEHDKRKKILNDKLRLKMKQQNRKMKNNIGRLEKIILKYGPKLINALRTKKPLQIIKKYPDLDHPTIGSLRAKIRRLDSQNKQN